MSERVTRPARVLSGDEALRMETYHKLYRFLLELAARKKAAARIEARNHTRTAAPVAPSAVKAEEDGGIIT